MSQSRLFCAGKEGGGDGSDCADLANDWRPCLWTHLSHDRGNRLPLNAPGALFAGKATSWATKPKAVSSGKRKDYPIAEPAEQDFQADVWWTAMI